MKLINKKKLFSSQSPKRVIEKLSNTSKKKIQKRIIKKKEYNLSISSIKRNKWFFHLRGFMLRFFADFHLVNPPRATRARNVETLRPRVCCGVGDYLSRYRDTGVDISNGDQSDDTCCQKLSFSLSLFLWSINRTRNQLFLFILYSSGQNLQ